MTNGLQQIFDSGIRKKNLFGKNDKLLLAFSGGMDSSALAFLLSTGQYSFALAHVNFKLRGADSDADAAFAKETAKKLGVDFYLKEFETEKEKKTGESIQMAARRFRYQWLEEIRKENGFQKILTAHHANDQAETILGNWIRGTGIKGMRGMLPVKNKLVRPLLSVSKNSIVEFVVENKIDFREDKSNAESGYKRNFIRHEILPKIQEINPAIIHTILHSAEIFAEQEFLVERQLKKISNRISSTQKNATQISINGLIHSGAPRSILHYLLSPAGFLPQQFAEILGAANSQAGTTFLSPSHRLIKDRKHFILTPLKTESESVILIERSIKQFTFNEQIYLISEQPFGSLTESKNKDSIILNLNKLRFPLVVRNWRAGDYFYPEGLNKKKKLSDFFGDLKLNSIQKESACVLLNEEKIVAVIPYRIDHRFRCGTPKEMALVIKAQ